LEFGCGLTEGVEATLEFLTALKLEVALGLCGSALGFHLLDSELTFGAGLELSFVEVAEVLLALACCDGLGLPELVESYLALACCKRLVLDELLELTCALGSGVTVEVHLAIDVEITFGCELRIVAEHALHFEVAFGLKDGSVQLILLAEVITLFLTRCVFRVEEFELAIGELIDLRHLPLAVLVVLLGAAFGLAAFAEGLNAADNRGSQL